MNPTMHVPVKDAKYCFVPACKNNSQKNLDKTFFAVPSTAKAEWCRAVNIACPKRLLYICEDHLNLQEDVENYRYWISMKGRPKLKSRLPQSLLETSSIDPKNSIEPQPSTSSASMIVDDICTVFEKPVKSHKAVQVKPKMSDRATYCSIHKKKPSKPTLGEAEVYTELVPTEEEIPSTQGSTTSADLTEVSSAVYIKPTLQGRNFMLGIIAKKPQNYIGLSKKYYWLIEYLQTKLNVRSFDIIITLYKIKNNVPFYQISDMFEVSSSTLWRMFSKTLCILAAFFKQLIFCPKAYDVKRNLPSSFKTNKEYSNVFCIIDCFEIEIEKPSNPVSQSLTWSQYKNANTLKYLIAATPDGFINFVSAGFGGRISDANIIEISGFLDAMPSNCTILADRGFKHVETLLNKKSIKLLRPPSVSKDTKLTKREAIKSKVIASLRIHVERVIRRVRQYKLLKPHAVINNKLIQNTDEIVIIACGLINLQNSVVNNE